MVLSFNGVILAKNVKTDNYKKVLKMCIEAWIVMGHLEYLDVQLPHLLPDQRLVGIPSL